MKKIVFAPDSFKGTISAERVCEIYKQALLKSFPDAHTVSLPISDGGEGLVNSMLHSCGGRRVTVKVSDPLRREINADYAVLPDGTAVIEMAAASGLPLLSPSERNPRKTTTFGTGELIKHALAGGLRKIILGLGGSATNDGGTGAAAALGMRFLKEDGSEIELCGEGLSELSKIDISGITPELLESEMIIACDVDNPVYGKNGAAYIYGPQKGASPEDVEFLDANLKRMSDILLNMTGLDLQSLKGSGAAGGCAVPFIVFADAKLRRGIDIALDAIGYNEALNGCDFVVTGEGSTDYQSSMGKAVYGVCSRASARNVPVIVISGALGSGYENLYQVGVTAMFSAYRRCVPLEVALSNAEENLFAACDDVFRLIKRL